MTQRRVPSGGGSKVERQPRHGGDYIYEPMPLVVESAPSSPQQWLTTPLKVGNYYFQAFTYSQSYPTVTSFGISATSSQWVDLVMMIVGQNTTIPAIQSVILDGKTVTQNPKMVGNTSHMQNGRMTQTFDVFGYGVSLTIIPTATFDAVTIFPAAPRTIINDTGSILWPPGLAGQSAARFTSA